MSLFVSIKLHPMQHYYSVSMIVKKTILPSVHGRLFLPEMTLDTLKNYRIISYRETYKKLSELCRNNSVY